MPTYLVGPTRPYTTIQAAVDAIPSSISGTGIHEVIIDAGVYSERAELPSKTGSDANNYVHIRSATDSYHGGLLSAGARISWSEPGASQTAALWIKNAYTRVSDLSATRTGSAGAQSVRIDGAVNCRLENVIGYQASANFTCFSSNAANTSFYKCLAISPSNNNNAGFLTTAANPTFLNCGSFNNGPGFNSSGFDGTAKNCWSYEGGAFSSFVLGSSGTYSKNASNDASAPGSGSLHNLLLADYGFVNSGSNDFHITRNSLLYGFGENLGGTFTTDIDNIPVGIWCIGPDCYPVLGSLNIDGASFRVKPWPTPLASPAILWEQDSAGKHNGSDRGAAQDAFETEVVFFGPEATINSLMDILEDNREGITLSDFAVPLFIPEIDHTGSISAAVLSRGPQRQVAFGLSSSVYELPVTFRAISPSLLGTTPSLASLRLQEAFEAGASYEVGQAFAYNQSAVYADRRADAGLFRGVFQQTTAEARAILAYLLSTARANEITMPTLPGVTYPFGVTRGEGPFQVTLPRWEIRRKDLNRWLISIDFAEAP